ncbi:esterase [Sphingomonas oleivorans]|uniref:Esterase n=1 Tax=Sphingomonas oleivorans TaxID=1735121 RepID=A0A2T5FTR0_9SPHN|nr:alpha/beta hydrolase [Sphingomonas oleivorans]PTQ07455.1 esterase [Sphingomonas oleivorans]
MAQAIGAEVNCLIVPGLNGSGPSHWQTRWEEERRDCVRVELGRWSDPIRDLWIGRLERAVMAAPGPAILVAHSLGCLATVWWAALAEPGICGKVKGVMLVAPADVEAPDAHPLLRRFASAPAGPLPFPAILVASHDDPYATFARQRDMAAQWHCQLIDVGRRGHINADSGLGSWPEGQLLLEGLIERSMIRI